MEIDFLGLNSTTKFEHMEKLNFSKDAIFPTETGEVETSLSLSRPSYGEILSEKNKWAEFYSSGGSSTGQPSLCLVPPPVFHPSTTAAGFLYNIHDDRLTELRKISEIPVKPVMLYSAGRANVLNYNIPEKGESNMYITGKNESHRLSDHTRNGYTPTVAMARRATLARFLEQRLHSTESSKDSPSHGEADECQQQGEQRP
ncbi:hypothetical protein CASFOL_023403 [Castilleja foliolosa]|uniref:Uncharacterized protein n=1 Tax=Castilleja foliolosa TaxID=1961234 RepID=A0ABD3CLM2_9LAMI